MKAIRYMKAKVKAKRRNKTTAAKVKTLARKVRAIAPESKYADINITNQAFNYDPTFSYVQNLFSGMAQGLGDTNSYTGDEIYHKGFRMSGIIYNNSALPLMGRIVLVKLKQNMEGLITTTNIGNLVMESAYTGGTNAPNCFLDNDNRKGVTILRDWKFTINPGNGVGNAATTFPTAVRFSRYVKTGFKVGFRAGGNVPATNGLYLFFIGDTTANGLMNYVLRHHYTDS